MAKPRPIRIKDAPEVCEQASAAWAKRYLLSDDTVLQWRACTSTVKSGISLEQIRNALYPAMTWRLPYDPRPQR